MDPGHQTPDQRDGLIRDETEAQRVDRNMAELLQELRVAGLGVQVLFGFLLSLPFTTRFTTLSGAQVNLYVATVLLAALSAALLTAPVAYHRLVFRRHEKERLLHVANRLAIVGLMTVALAISAAVLLVVSVVLSGVAIPLITAATVATFAGLWFGLPLQARRTPEPDPSRAEPADTAPAVPGRPPDHPEAK
jgi:hypothetical protein